MRSAEEEVREKQEELDQWEKAFSQLEVILSRRSCGKSTLLTKIL